MGQILTSTPQLRAEDIIELQLEAAEARQLSAFFRDAATIHDLKNYAIALERMIADAKDLSNGAAAQALSEPPSVIISQKLGRSRITALSISDKSM